MEVDGIEEWQVKDILDSRQKKKKKKKKKKKYEDVSPSEELANRLVMMSLQHICEELVD